MAPAGWSREDWNFRMANENRQSSRWLDGQCGTIIDTEAACSFLWFVAIQGIKRKQDLTGLAPKACFIAAQAIQREVGQIGKTQKATRELNGRSDRI
jgi:hypothetical protein